LPRKTIFKLTNGQIWQQAEYSYEYEYDYRPSVLIYKTGNGYKMKVADMEETRFKATAFFAALKRCFTP
jgi:hypothetical protein